MKVGGSSNTTLTITSGKILQLESGSLIGGVLVGGVGDPLKLAKITGGTLQFGKIGISEPTEPGGPPGRDVLLSREGVVSVPKNAVLEIVSVVDGDLGLTKSGEGTLRLS